MTKPLKGFFSKKSDYQECCVTEHNQKQYSWLSVSPLALSNEILALDTPSAWETSECVYFIEESGKICGSKGRLGNDVRKFVVFPPIPGLRLSLEKDFVTFDNTVGRAQLKNLHRRLARTVALDILSRADMLPGADTSDREAHMLVSGLSYDHKHVRSICAATEVILDNFEVCAVSKKSNNAAQKNKPAEFA